MRIKNVGLPLLACGAALLFLLYAPEKLSGIFDEAAIGRQKVSEVDDEVTGNLSVADRIRLFEDYGKNADIICVREDYSGGAARDTADVFPETEPRQPSREFVARIQEELDLLRQASLLPEIALEEMDVTVFSFERYLDIRDEQRYLALATLQFDRDGTTVFVRYDIENGILLMCNYVGDALLSMEMDDQAVQKGWSEYLGISQEEAERYYFCERYQDEGRDVSGVSMAFL